MKFFLDTANLDELRKGAAWGIVDGVTTKSFADRQRGKTARGAHPGDLRDYRRRYQRGGGRDHIAGDDSEGRKLVKIHRNVVVKCPLTRDGIMATKALSSEGIRVQCYALLFRQPGFDRRQGGSVHHQPVRGADRRHQLDRHGPDSRHRANLPELRLQDADSGGLAAGAHARLPGGAGGLAHRYHAVQGLDMLFNHPLTDKDWSNS